MSAKIKVEWGSDNIFADLGFADAEERLLKANIVSELHRLKNARGLTQVKTGKLLGISQPEVSRLFRGHFDEYSVERLMRFMTAFGRDVEIVTRPSKGARKQGKISFAPVPA